MGQLQHKTVRVHRAKAIRATHVRLLASIEIY